MESEPVDFGSGAPNAKLRPADLLGLERYARERAELRARVIAHKKRRTVPCGPNVTFCFEDRVTVQYQVQEMLRIERIFEAHGIAEELDSLQPADPGRLQLEGDLAGRVPRPGGAACGARRTQGHRGPLLGRGRRSRAGVCDRRRGPRARERGEDLVGAFPALRARDADDLGCQARRRDQPGCRSRAILATR